MMQTRFSIPGVLAALAAASLLAAAAPAAAAIEGLTGTSFSFTARAGYISTPEGNSVYMWGFADGAGVMQYPGPTLLLEQDAPVTVTLTNALPVAVSILFPGQAGQGASGGVPGLLAREALPGQTVTYTFTPERPGTYTYYSGTDSDLQTEMGLVGAIVVRPATAGRAYLGSATAYDREFLFLLGDLDPVIHKQVERGNLHLVDMSARWAVYWTINGRMAPDTMADSHVPWLPSQPYNCVPAAHPHEKVLLRLVGAGRDGHPYHTHGNHHRIIARDGVVLGQTPTDIDLSIEAFTTSIMPGETVDALFSWTGEGLGWDAYGPISLCTDVVVNATGAPGPDGRDDATGLACHDAECTDVVVNATGDPAPDPADGFDDATGEYCADHGKPLPVILPTQQELTFGPWFSGSPYLGSAAPLPPGEGGLNPNAAFTFMWHSHNEREIVNFDIFPGGMLTMFFVEHAFVDLAGY